MDEHWIRLNSRRHFKSGNCICGYLPKNIFNFCCAWSAEIITRKTFLRSTFSSNVGWKWSCLVTAVQLDDANSEFADSVKKLQAAIKYGEGEIQAAKSLVDQSASGDADKHVNYGCILYKVIYSLNAHLKDCFCRFCWCQHLWTSKFWTILFKFSKFFNWFFL